MDRVVAIQAVGTIMIGIGAWGVAPLVVQAAINEANRQRDYMEKTVHTLKKTLKLAGKNAAKVQIIDGRKFAFDIRMQQSST